MNKYKQLYQQSMVANQQLVNAINNGICSTLKADFNKDAYENMLIAKDIAMCSVRYIWENLPMNLTSQQLESMFHRWGSLCFFVHNGTLIASRYTLIGELNPYGKLCDIQPIDLAGHSYGKRKTAILSNGANVADGVEVAIIINDYTGNYQSELLSRYAINKESTIHDQVEVYEQLANNIMLSQKKALAICKNEEQKNAVMESVKAFFNTSAPIVPITSSTKKDAVSELPIEMYNFQNTFDTQNYCQQIDYYDKIRRSFDGIPAPDTFEKKERKVVGETEDTTTHTNMMLDDGLRQRQNGLELMQKYLDCDGIESITVELNPLLIDKSTEKEVDINDINISNNQDENNISNV